MGTRRAGGHRRRDHAAVPDGSRKGAGTINQGVLRAQLCLGPMTLVGRAPNMVATMRKLPQESDPNVEPRRSSAPVQGPSACFSA